VHATLCDLIMDLVQNSAEAGATEIELTFSETSKAIEFSVKDNGKGMSKEVQAKAIDPFYSDGKKHAHRRVGLGLPFLLQTAEAADGTAMVESKEGCGTTVQFRAQTQHVDLPPVGDFVSSAVLMMTQPLDGDLRIIRRTARDSYTLSRIELEKILGNLNDIQNLQLLKTYIESQEENLEKAG